MFAILTSDLGIIYIYFRTILLFINIPAIIVCLIALLRQVTPSTLNSYMYLTLSSLIWYKFKKKKKDYFAALG